MNEQNTKLMVMSKIKKQAKLVISSVDSEQVDHFCYLDSIITHDNSNTDDIDKLLPAKSLHA